MNRVCTAPLAALIAAVALLAGCQRNADPTATGGTTNPAGTPPTTSPGTATGTGTSGGATDTSGTSATTPMPPASAASR